MEDYQQKKYVTPEGYDSLKKELEHAKEERKKIAEEIQIAKEKGDLSENAEYADAKDKQAFNEGRIMELESMLKTLKIVKKQDCGTVSVGCQIKVKHSENGEKEFTIVGPSEVNPREGKISNESPLGRAFLGKTVGERVQIITPKGEIEYKILEIK